VRALGLAVLALVVFAACNTQSPVFTPDPKNPAYHCHDSSGAVIADAVWCYPTDGTHTCCPFEHQCSSLGGDQTCEFIGRPDQATFAARKPAKRLPESP
jgi:hypothetical protein